MFPEIGSALLFIFEMFPACNISSKKLVSAKKGQYIPLQI